MGPKGTVLHQLLVAALKKEGMTIKDVDFISMDPAKAMTAVLSGSADAGLVAAGLIIKAKRRRRQNDYDVRRARRTQSRNGSPPGFC